MKKIYLLVCLAVSLSFAEYIGVLAKKGTCPDDQTLTMFIDVEDHNKETRILRGDTKPLGVDLSDNLKFTYCRFNYDKMVRVPYDYVVLKMDRKCPKGSYAFARYHDSEDDDNDNWYKGVIGPSVISSNAYLTYCYVPADSKSKIKYPFKKKYGVFANPKNLPSNIADNIAHSEIFVDDEDSNNKNGWQWYKTKEEYKDPIKKIVSVTYKDPETGKNVTSKKNTVYHTLRWTGSDSDLPAMVTSSKTKIGVLKRKGSCPGDEITIKLDLEDSDSETEVEEGNKNPPGISISEKQDLTFTYCALEVEKMPQVPYDYMVLRLGLFCPEGTYPVTRYHDTEDHNNKNSFTGSIWPNKIKRNAFLEYCFVPANSKSKLRYPFEGDDAGKYGVFANPKNVSSKILNNIAHSKIHLDDEDDRTQEEDGEECRIESNDWEVYDAYGNIVYDEFGNPVYDYEQETVCDPVYKDVVDNQWFYYDASSSIQSRIMKIMDGVNNTDYHVIKWIGSSSAVLARSVNENPVEELAVTGVAAPKIMGFDNSAVTIEARATGKVSVSIMNAKGAVVANVAQDNFQPGIHRVNWNSGPVPNGRYIVVVKQNGMETAKNVILK